MLFYHQKIIPLRIAHHVIISQKEDSLNLIKIPSEIYDISHPLFIGQRSSDFESIKHHNWDTFPSWEIFWSLGYPSSLPTQFSHSHNSRTITTDSQLHPHQRNYRSWIQALVNRQVIDHHLLSFTLSFSLILHYFHEKMFMRMLTERKQKMPLMWFKIRGKIQF